MLSADPGDLVVEFCRRFLPVEGEERCFPIGAVSDAADRGPVRCHLVPSYGRGIYIGVLPAGCQMVPVEAEANDVLVIAAFRAGDLRRLHTLLCCYESPFGTDAEAEERRADLGDAERLRCYVRSLRTALLAQPCNCLQDVCGKRFLSEIFDPNAA